MSASSVRPPYPLISSGFLASYWTTMRPYLMFLSGITGLAGASMAGPLDPADALLIGTASFFSYGFGQALTDCFQTDTDALSAPYRPLVQGRIRRLHVLTISLGGLICCVAVFAFFQPLNLLWGLLAVCGLATYTPFKRRWWGGPWYNAWIVCVLFIMGYLAGSAGSPVALPDGFFLLLGCVLFGYAAFVLIGYFKDITADRATGYRTLPVVFGRRVSAFIGDVFIAAAVACYLLALLQLIGEDLPLRALLVAVLLGTGGIGTAIGAGMLTHRSRNDLDAHPAIALTVHSYILLLSSIVVMREPAWSFPVAAFYGGFVLTLHARPAEHQI